MATAVGVLRGGLLPLTALRRRDAVRQGVGQPTRAARGRLRTVGLQRRTGGGAGGGGSRWGSVKWGQQQPWMQEPANTLHSVDTSDVVPPPTPGWRDALNRKLGELQCERCRLPAAGSRVQSQTSDPDHLLLQTATLTGGRTPGALAGARARGCCGRSSPLAAPAQRRPLRRTAALPCPVPRPCMPQERPAAVPLLQRRGLHSGGGDRGRCRRTADGPHAV